MEDLNKLTKEQLIEIVQNQNKRELDLLRNSTRIFLRTNQGNVAMQIAESHDEEMACVIADCLIKYYTKKYNPEGKIQAEVIFVRKGFGNDSKVLMKHTFPWYIETGEY